RAAGVGGGGAAGRAADAGGRRARRVGRDRAARRRAVTWCPGRRSGLSAAVVGSPRTRMVRCSQPWTEPARAAARWRGWLTRADAARSAEVAEWRTARTT